MNIYNKGLQIITKCPILKCSIYSDVSNGYSLCDKLLQSIKYTVLLVWDGYVHLKIKYAAAGYIFETILPFPA